MTPTLQALLALGAGVLFLILLIYNLRKGLQDEADIQTLKLYAGAGLLTSLVQGLLLLGWPEAGLSEALRKNIPLYLIILNSLIFLDLTAKFLRVRSLGSFYWGIALLWIAGILSLDIFQIEIPGNPIPPDRLIWTLVGITWITIFSRVGQVVYVQYATKKQPLHQNRMNYWIATTAITTIGGVMFLGGLAGSGLMIQALATAIGVYALVTYRPADIRIGVLQVGGFIIITLLVLVIYSGVYLLTQVLIQNVMGQPPWVGAVTMALVLAILFHPILNRLQRELDTRLGRTSIDSSQTIREYSLTISNIIDISQLATVAIGLISEAMEISRGLIFLVDQSEDKDGKVIFELNGVQGGMGILPPEPGNVPIDSPIAIYMSKERHPLIQYDIDFLDRFKGANSEEKKWFSKLGMDVYVPIYGHGLWIGMLAIGPKAAGVPYTPEDLTLLSTLADQTAVALENARLVEGLVEINKRVETAYSNLASTKQELERLDRAKSDFISIASHELRTPLTVIHGYTQMLADADEVKQNQYFSSLIEGIDSGTYRLQEIVDSMLDVAKIDNRELELAPMPLSVNSMLESIQRSLESTIAERNQTLIIADMRDLPPIEVDREAIQKVFHHLIINAIKYTPNKGKIQISGRLSPSKEEHIEIIVADSGIGIDSEHLQLIFRKFYQTGEIGLHSSGKSKFKGAGPGLGLAIAQGVIAAHGGEIWVESPGYDEKKFPGSKFFVQLPLRQIPDPVEAEQK